MPLHYNKSFLTHSWCKNSINRSLVKTKLHKNKDTQLEGLPIWCTLKWHFDIKLLFPYCRTTEIIATFFALCHTIGLNYFWKYLEQLSFRCMKMRMLFQTSFHLIVRQCMVKSARDKNWVHLGWFYAPKSFVQRKHTYLVQYTTGGNILLKNILFSRTFVFTRYSFNCTYSALLTALIFFWKEKVWIS